MHKKIFINLLVFSLVAVILAACGIEDTATTPSGTSTPTTQTTAATTPGAGQFPTPVDMTNQSAVTIDIILPPSGAACTPACFQYPNVKVKVGTKITWVNKSTTGHTVTAIVGENPSSPTPAPKIFDSGVTSLIATGQSYTYKVDAAAYNFNKDHMVVYYCQVHPVMVAALTIVQ
jgi:plastocyanin